MSEEYEEYEENYEDLDIETRAKQMGWTPEEKFRGDPDKWLDAEAFVQRAETELPIAIGTIRTLARKLERMERRTGELTDTLEKFSNYHKTTLDRETARAAAEYQRGLEEAQAQMRQAVEEGDLDAFDEAQARSEKLMREAGQLRGANEPEDLPKPDPEITRKWAEENPWFTKEFKMNRYARECGDFLAMTKPTQTQKEQLTEIAQMVKEEFPDYFTNPARRKAAAVDSGDQTASPNNRGKKGYSDLPPEAKAACDQFCRDIKGFTKEKYLAQYRGPWKG